MKKEILLYLLIFLVGLILLLSTFYIPTPPPEPEFRRIFPIREVFI
jgi:hypothetical protein